MANMANDKNPRKQRFFVKVHPLQAEGTDRGNPIPVNDLGDPAHGRAVCYPNKKGVLSLTQINILRESVERFELAIPEDSGILEEADPLAMAEKQYPGFTATRDKLSGQVIVHKNKPRFSVEVLGKVPDPAAAKVEAKPVAKPAAKTVKP